MGHDQSMWNAHYIPIHHIIAKSWLSTNFSTGCPGAREIEGLPKWSRIEYREFIQNISSRFYLAVSHYDNWVKII